MPMLKDPSSKYLGSAPMLVDRTWPSRQLNTAPRWLSTDLRDGNQALASPLSITQKWRLFNLLVDIGFREIEIGFPAASETDYEFTRQCVAAAPADCWIQVMCPCRKDMIERTIDALQGAKKVIVSLYIATSDEFIETVFRSSRDTVLNTAVEHVEYLKSLTIDSNNQQKTSWTLMWSPETFSDTDPQFAIQICQAVKSIWKPSEAVGLILNLPATVERSTPNIFADQVEIFSRAFTSDPFVCVSVHVHNDRGCAVAATELAQLAGASRVEGCLFGNGERTGNVDLVTLALNLYTQGVDPKLDFSDLASIRGVMESLTQIPVHTRAPYSGDSVFLAYSGGHQDAIQKGMEKRKRHGDGASWKVPYLPIDPRDIGASYEAIIKVNSQSGKGGIAWVLEQATGRKVPKTEIQALSAAVKSKSEALGRTLEADEIVQLGITWGIVQGVA